MENDDRIPSILHQSENGEYPLPNLAPRHQELIPTPLGPIKPWSELSWPIRGYFCLTISSLVVVLGLTIMNMTTQQGEDFSISLIQLIGIVFCMYYVTRAILQENRQELIIFLLSVLLVMGRAIINFIVLSDKGKASLLPRFVLILVFGLFHVVCASFLLRSQNMMAFRVGGALESLQHQYFMLNLCFSMLTFDLQAQLCLCLLLLVLGLHDVSLLHSIILGFGLFWACLKVVIGIMAILKELKALVWIFLLQNLPEVAYLIYLLYTVMNSWGAGKSYTLEAATLIGSCVSVMIKSVLFWALFHVYCSFGQGLRERMFSSYGRIDS
ncbi:uncharacterized protein LOC115458990 isoform X2 [Microcaecilia unicolor]|uniref:Uncharacterized protein LOC115456597 isoform X2 n=1 Tax=Microcaecilia unicolor TaxID=1415580 RepID=A0A6P7WNC2_9AMPH|nr:uncharacterized protein LOC115456597 isoform X2 [Microcaecilia unicolor]XP_030044712.1 uncharacterized protein LOC115458990 isoform X2 [Microcaecilia unicolor]